MINITPGPIFFALGPIQIHWYGLAYVVAILAAAWIITREAERRGLDTSVIPDGLVIVAAAALVGGRAYHVIDQWSRYQNDLLAIVMPPYTGLGVYGGIALGAVAMILYVRWKRLDFWAWADVVALGILAAQVVGRFGNFFNQELYGPPTNLPWGIAIQCKNRIGTPWPCPAGSNPEAVLDHFHPLFLYESLLSLLGLLVLMYVLRRFVGPGRPLITGDVGMLYFVWYGVERALLEFFRIGYDWTFFGVPTAQVVGLAAAAVAVAIILFRHWRHRRSGDREAAGVDRETPHREPARGETARGETAGALRPEPGSDTQLESEPPDREREPEPQPALRGPTNG